MHRITNRFKILIRFLKKHNNFFQTLVNLGMLIISIFAIRIAVESYKSANQQFIDNSIKSDSIFKIQLANERKININLEKIQELSNSQIKITNQQLDISSKILDDQINAKRPILAGFKDTLTDQYITYNNKYAPIIHTSYCNIGQRYAYNVNFRVFLISRDFVIESTNVLYKTPQAAIGPESLGELQYKPKIDIDSYKSDNVCFYYCYEISYYDKLTMKEHHYTNFIEYTNDRGKFLFFFCNDEIKVKLIKVINEELKLYKKTCLKE